MNGEYWEVLEVARRLAARYALKIGRKSQGTGHVTYLRSRGSYLKDQDEPCRRSVILRKDVD